MNIVPKVYADNNATTAVFPDVLEAMVPYLTDYYANAASVHAFGAQLMHVIDGARDEIIRLLGADEKDDITFTSGGTESNNAIIRSALTAFPGRKHVVSSSVEHSSVANVLIDLEMEGFEVTRIPVNREGKFDLEMFEKSIRSDTALVTVMWANNETGAVFPVEEMSRIARKKNVLFHCDAVQAIGKVPINLRRTPVDYLSISAHKLHGPKGVGVLYARKGAPFTPLLRGGSQQHGRRAGTEDVAGIAGLGKACRLEREFLAADPESRSIRLLRDRLEKSLQECVKDAVAVASKSDRLPNTSFIIFEHAPAETLLQLMSEHGICASGGSACTSGTTEPSRVLLAMGFSERQALSAIRFSLGRLTKEEEIDYLIETVPHLVSQVRQRAPFE